MVKEIYKNIFLIEVPLPNSPLKNLNSYLIRGETRHLLIDTGFNREACYAALSAGLSEIGADMERTDVFLTHHHSDHSGLCQRIASNSSKIYISKEDKSRLLKMHEGSIMAGMHDRFRSLGLPDDILEQNLAGNPAIIYRPEGYIDYTEVDEATQLEVGRYRLRVIKTPGHTPGHCCLYEPKHKLLFSGDHIIFHITPNITTWDKVDDSLGDYMNSLEKTRQLDVENTFSAHRQPMGDSKTRIDELIRHHECRLEEAYGIIKAYPASNAYQVASRMKWSIRVNSWEEFPSVQKWFATGEAASHLEYLYYHGRLQRKETAGRIVYI